MRENFYTFQNEFSAYDEVRNLVHTSTRWSLRHPKSQVIGIAVPIEMMLKDLAFSSLYNNYKSLMSQPVVFRWDPYTQYDWHIDGTRGCALNLLIDMVPSHTLFKTGSKGIKGVDYIYEYELAPYSPKKFNLLDVKKEHSVINFECTRYVISAGIMKSFKEVKEYCIANNF
jgi:hypothetical protein